MVSTANYKQLLDSLSTSVVVVNSHLEITYLNPTAEALLAISGTRIIGTSILNYFVESEAAVKSMQDAAARNHHYTKRRAGWRLHNGQKLTVDYTVTALGDEQGLAIEIQPLDRLLRISREEALISAQETTRNLVRGMAHEIKNPLGGIRGAAQLLSRELPSEELSEYTTVIIEEADRLRNLVDRMLGPRQLPNWSYLNIHEVLERVSTLITAESDGKVTLTRDYDPSIPELPGDRELLIQATLNIVRNAMQALNEANTENPSISLCTRIQRQFTIGRDNHPLVCRVDVRDNGPGIAPEIIEDIFYPMISGRAEGTGLGLAISQQLINQHNGLIECESRPGNTVFSLYIPMEHSHAEAK
ncbi:nitrogen regulation protein NR(II) [Marinibactrum halimedae]|uniref:Sensory histidine kinase/phosphatase NtrB n=1 Tax=Marinibactrum halimedae TaxID=1444977 RepID=A0AA37T2M8_9GAMM|nr:nitrogen regulation protein NR(II) [Marinibactrum halimedae]MCD9459309.1 nitrogen regulation protein NR(II) [Marinibactrum halimedae]GLS25799.1 PAS domain-containing sensor histidine kinase [Marinibactrum halimedae]